jgi:hypothetical protein
MQVLTQELNRVNEQLSKLSFYKDKLTTLISAHDAAVTPVVTVERKLKNRNGKKAVISSMLLERIAGYVSEQVRRNGYTKSSAIDNAITMFKLPKTEAIKKRLGSSLTPSAMGKEKYNELFKGTKYAAD